MYILFNLYFYSSLIFCLLFFFYNKKDFILYCLLFSFWFSIFLFLILDLKLKQSNIFLIYKFIDISIIHFLFIWNIDSFSLIFVTLNTFILILCLIWSWNYSWNKKNMYLFFLFLDFLLKGCFFAFDIFTFFIFFESILISILFFIGVLGLHERKIKAIYFFYIYTLLGSFFIIFGILILMFEAGTSSLFLLNNLNLTFKKQIFLWPLISLSFLIKIPVFPFHLWLPEAHVEASTIGSVFLAALLLKLGGFGFIKFTLPLLPYASIYFTPIIEILCSLGFFCCSFDALRQVDTKKIIAYSSVVHMNLVVFSIFTNTLKGLIGATILMIAHGLTSAGLFFVLGSLYDRYLTRNVFYFKGLVIYMPILSVCSFLFLLSNIAFPGTINFISELLIFSSLIQTNFNLIFIFFGVGLVVNTYFNFIFYTKIFFGSFLGDFDSNQNLQDTTKREFFVFFLLIFLLIFFGFFPEKIISSIQVYLMYVNIRVLI